MQRDQTDGDRIDHSVLQVCMCVCVCVCMYVISCGVCQAYVVCTCEYTHTKKKHIPQLDFRDMEFRVVSVTPMSYVHVDMMCKYS